MIAQDMKGSNMDLKKYIDSFPDFPDPKIMFRDISPLVALPHAFAYTIEKMEAYINEKGANKLAAFDARGFIFGSALALKMELPLVLLRKKGKLPGETVSLSYGKEYGKGDTIEIRVGFVDPGDRVVLVDDLLATGGTARAGLELIESLGADVLGLASVIELTH